MPARRATTRAGVSCRSGIASGGRIQLEANIDYDKPDADWYFAPTRRKAEVLIDPYEYRVAGKNLFITSTAAPILHAGRCVGVVGFDVHMDWLLEAMDEPGPFESIEAAIGRGHVLLGEDGQVRYCGRATRRLICRYVGGKPVPDAAFRSLFMIWSSRSCGGASFRRASSPSVHGRSVTDLASWLFGSRAIRRRAAFFCSLTNKSGMVVPTGPAVDLSPREQEVAEWVGQGKSNEEIAIILGISAHTVKNHLDKIFRKLGVENRCAAAAALQRDHHPGKDG